MKLECNLEGMISYSQFDYTGKRLAVVNSDRIIRLYSYIDNSLSEISRLDSHLGEILSLSWSHPKFGSLLASSGSDRKLIVWREQSLRTWNSVFEHNDSAIINCLSFAPWELGLKLIAGLEDGSILLVFFNNTWTVEKFSGHHCAIKTLAWGNSVSLINGLNSTEPQFRFIAGTFDGKLKLYTQSENSFISETLEKHAGCIRDVSWNPIISSNKEIFASCSERCVIIWVKKLDDPVWKPKDILSFPAPVWKVSWNSVGNSLAISVADNFTRVLKENNEEHWKVVQQVNPKGEVEEFGLGNE